MRYRILSYGSGCFILTHGLNSLSTVEPNVTVKWLSVLLLILEVKGLESGLRERL